MPAQIDAYKQTIRNALKKTGDAMTAGFLTLFQDAVEPLHAVPLRQLQDATAGLFNPKPRRIGNKYTTQFGSHSSSASPVSVGEGRMGILFAGGTHTWDQMTVHVVTVGTRTGRMALYSLDPETLLPDALLYDAGVFSYAGVAGERTLAITPALQTTANWLGLAMILETAGTGSITSTTSNNDANSRVISLFGTDAVASLTLNVNVLYCSTGIAGAPAPGAWSVPTASPQTHDGGVYIRKSA
jgi:hypothetical protein